jgi:putative cardiolipin synthase
VLTIGPVVGNVSVAFDQYWNTPLSIPVAALIGKSGDSASLDALRADLTAFLQTQSDSVYVTDAKAELTENIGTAGNAFSWGTAHLLYDSPAKISRAPEVTEGHLMPQFANLGSEVRNELLIVSPYFVPGDKGVAWLGAMVKRGVRVTVLTNSLAATDVGSVHAGYKRYRQGLLEAGVTLYELKPDAIEHERAKRKGRGVTGSSASLHAKTFVFDRRAVFIGSMNVDPRSIQLNTEIGVVCESPALAEALASGLEQNLAKIAWRLDLVADASGSSQLVWVETGANGTRQLLQEPGVSVWRQLGVWFLGLLPIESQL